MEHKTQPMPDSGRGFRAKVFQVLQVVPCLFGRGDATRTRGGHEHRRGARVAG